MYSTHRSSEISDDPDIVLDAPHFGVRSHRHVLDVDEFLQKRRVPHSRLCKEKATLERNKRLKLWCLITFVLFINTLICSLTQ